MSHCEILKQFASNAQEDSVHEKTEFAWKLCNGKPQFQLEKLEKYDDSGKWKERQIPSDATHVAIVALLLDQFYIKPVRSRYGNTATVAMEDHIGVLAKVLSSKGKNCCPAEFEVYSARTMSQWILKKGAAKPKRLYSKLKTCSTVTTDDMIWTL